MLVSPRTILPIFALPVLDDFFWPDFMVFSLHFGTTFWCSSLHFGMTFWFSSLHFGTTFWCYSTICVLSWIRSVFFCFSCLAGGVVCFFHYACLGFFSSWCKHDCLPFMLYTGTVGTSVWGHACSAAIQLSAQAGLFLLSQSGNMKSDNCLNVLSTCSYLNVLSVFYSMWMLT